MQVIQRMNYEEIIHKYIDEIMKKLDEVYKFKGAKDSR